MPPGLLSGGHCIGCITRKYNNKNLTKQRGTTDGECRGLSAFTLNPLVLVSFCWRDLLKCNWSKRLVEV